MNWKIQMFQARNKYMMDRYAACRDFGVPVQKYSDKTANGLTKCILDFLKFKNLYANRINTTGIMRNINGQMKWTKGTTNKGTADIMAIINGKHVAIEVKIGRDKMSEAQHREKQRIEKAGGVYFIARSMEEFMNFFEGLGVN